MSDEMTFPQMMREDAATKLNLWKELKQTRKELSALRASHTELFRLLKLIQWTTDEGANPVCVACGRPESSGHLYTCGIGNALENARKVMG